MEALKEAISEEEMERVRPFFEAETLHELKKKRKELRRKLQRDHERTRNLERIKKREEKRLRAALCDLRRTEG